MPFCYATIRVWKPLPRGVPAVPTTLAEHLRRRRFDLGHGQEEAARRIGVCLETVTKLERGRLDSAALEARERVFEAIAPGG